jgi:hypothetical protein
MISEILDKYGKRVTRPNGVLQDGDTYRVPMRMMDAVDPGLAAAAALADAVRRNEQFDASHAAGHKPGYSTQDAGDAGVTAREARDAKMLDAWKNPPSVTTGDAPVNEQIAVIVGPTAPVEQLQAARDKVIAQRDKQLEAAWAK